jgi:hypothetical protein
MSSSHAGDAWCDQLRAANRTYQQGLGQEILKLCLGFPPCKSQSYQEPCVLASLRSSEQCVTRANCGGHCVVKLLEDDHSDTTAGIELCSHTVKTVTFISKFK